MHKQKFSRFMKKLRKFAVGGSVQACKLIQDLQREKARQDGKVDGIAVKKALVGLSELCKTGKAHSDIVYLFLPVDISHITKLM